MYLVVDMKKLSVIIFENDAEAIQSLQIFEAENRVLFSIISIENDITNLVSLVNEFKPDAIILAADIFSFPEAELNKIVVRKPKLVFISKHKEDAFKAYANIALDFILKPLNPNYLIVSVYRIIRYIEMENAYQQKVLSGIEDINKKENKAKHVTITSVDKIEILKTDAIMYCKADGKYTEFYTVKGKKLSSKNIGEYSTLLEEHFFRIHHSYVVNIKYIDEVIKKNGVFCKLSNGDILPVSRRKQESFINFINKK